MFNSVNTVLQFIELRHRYLMIGELTHDFKIQISK